MGIFDDPVTRRKRPLDEWREEWSDERWDSEDGDSEIADTESWDDDTNTGYDDYDNESDNY